MHFPGLPLVCLGSGSNAPEHPVRHCSHVLPWPMRVHRSILPPRMLRAAQPTKMQAPSCPVSLLGAQGQFGINLQKALKGYQAGRGKGGERKAQGNHGSLTIVRSSHRVEEDFPDPLTLRLGSERKRKHICTDPLSELPQGGAQSFWPFATCRAMHTDTHS